MKHDRRSQNEMVEEQLFALRILIELLTSIVEACLFGTQSP